MIRVLQMVAHAMPGPDGRRGVSGPELRTLNALRHFDRSRVEIMLTYNPAGRLWDGFVASGTPVIEFRGGDKFDPRVVGAVVEILKANRIDVVHTQGPGSLDLRATIAARRVGIPVVVTRPSMITQMPIPKWRLLAYRAADRYTLRYADRVVAVSRAGLEHLRRRCGVPPARLELVYNGVDLDRFRPGGEGDRKRFGLPDRVPVVGACAQLTAGKAWGDFLEVVKRLRARLGGIRGMIVGDGPMRESLEQRAERAGLRNAVVFTGHIDDVHEALRCLDLVVFMSRREGLSVAIIEAMASGLPCVVTDVGGAREQVEDGRNGYLVPCGAVDAAADRAREILTDPAKLRRMGRESRAICEQRFEQSNMVRNYQRIYEELARAARGRKRPVRRPTSESPRRDANVAARSRVSGW